MQAIGVKVQNGYGLTETSPVIAARRPRCNVSNVPNQMHWKLKNAGIITIGWNSRVTKSCKSHSQTHSLVGQIHPIIKCVKISMLTRIVSENLVPVYTNISVSVHLTWKLFIIKTFICSNCLDHDNHNKYLFAFYRLVVNWIIKERCIYLRMLQMEFFKGYWICWASNSSYRIQNSRFWNWWSSSTWFKGHFESQGATSDGRILQGNLLCQNASIICLHKCAFVGVCVCQREKENLCVLILFVSTNNKY